MCEILYIDKPKGITSFDVLGENKTDGVTFRIYRNLYKKQAKNK